MLYPPLGRRQATIEARRPDPKLPTADPEPMDPKRGIVQAMAALWSLTLVIGGSAQDSGTTKSEPETLVPASAAGPQQQDPEPSTDGLAQELAWPRDRERSVARIGGREHTLEDVLRHIDERHFHGMLALMETPSGAAYLQSPQMAAWVRQYADVKALEAVAADREISYADAQPILGDALQKAFEPWLQNYVDNRAKRGNPVELTQERTNLLLTEFQRNNGLGSEVQGWLDVLVDAPDLEAVGKLRDYYNDHPEYFGGVITAAHILVRHRDPNSLELLRGEARQAAIKKIADIQSRLEPDGSNFEELARRFSEDKATASDGGRLQGMARFDDRLPASLCRAAWQLRDGQVSGIVETPYGLHLIKRVAYHHLYYVLFTERIHDDIANTMRREAQENLLFGTRGEMGVTLRF